MLGYHASAQWAVHHATFVPMLYVGPGYAPEMIRKRHAVLSDSSTALLAPMTSYFGFDSSGCERYKKNTVSPGTLMAMMEGQRGQSVMFLGCRLDGSVFWCFEVISYLVLPSGSWRRNLLSITARQASMAKVEI